MGLVHVASLPGFLPVSVTSDLVLGVTAQGVARWSLGARAPTPVANLSQSLFARTLGRHPLVRRAARLGVGCGHHLAGKRYLVADRRAIHQVSLDGTTSVEKTFEGGMRALRLTRVEGVPGFEDGVYYGDYGSNPTRHPLTLHRRDTTGTWRQVFSFPQGAAEHVHAIVPDSARSCLWIFTGDYEDAAGIWQATEGFARVEPVLRGVQWARACVGFPLDRGLLYATDSHLEPNSIRLLEEDGGAWKSREIRPMVGSCIYGGSVAGRNVFTTAVEPGAPTGNRVRDLFDLQPGPGILGRSVELVSGTLAQGFQTDLRWEVDWLPKRIFQFSTIIVPDLDRDATMLAGFAMGLRGRDGRAEIFKFSP